MSRFPRAFAAFGVSTALCALSALPVAPVVAAPLSDANSNPAAQAEKSRPITTPDPSGPDAHEDSTWANPLARSTDPKQDVRLEITDIAPAEAHGAQVQDPAASQTYTLRIRNDRPRALSNLSLTLYYRTAATSAEVRVAQIANQGEYALRSEPLQLDGILGPGESREVQVTLPLGADSHDAPSAQSLTIPANAFKEPGAYPLLFSLSGQDTNPEDAGQSGVQYLAVTRTTLTVGASERKEEQPSTPVTVLYPLAGQTYMAPGQTGDAPKRRPAFLTKDQLAKEVADGGRLRGLLDAYREAKSKKLKQATCIAIDPELLDTVNRLAEGYFVGDKAPDPVEEPKRLRDSWDEILGGKEPDAQHKPGNADAKRWVDDLREVVQNNCSVALPYAGADINALAQVDSDWLRVRALGMGPSVIQRILGVMPMQNVVVPDSGYVSPETQKVLAAGITKSPDKVRPVEADASQRFEQTVQGEPAIPQAGHVTALVADNTVTVERPAASPTDAQHGTTPNPTPSPSDEEWNQRLVNLPTPPGAQGTTATALQYSADLGTVLKATGEDPEVSAYSNPELRFNLEEDSSAARMATAQAVLNLELDSGRPTLAVPPAAWSVNKSQAASFLQTISQRLDDSSARPAPLSEAVQPRGIDLPDAAAGTTQLPYSDPGAYSTPYLGALTDTARDLRQLTLFMHNDGTIALTREGFTSPLFADLLRGVSSYRKRDHGHSSILREELRNRVSRVEQVTTQLRRSISLLPPGNVFTRTSDSSPLLVVARNGLPLPVTAVVGYSSDADTDVTVHTDSADSSTIPAKGSITWSLTTDIADTSKQVNLSLWLATANHDGAGDLQDGTRISDPVELRVQSVPGLSARGLAIIAAVLLGIGAAGKMLWDRRGGRSSRSAKAKPLKAEPLKAVPRPVDEDQN
ncbi:hypothetical protein HMPREF2678_04770 [Corynebacterium sp. HMSC058E07]|uniref:hypothetical protein n=1 Tax=Corynebacterium sp. HMSC058E07 TaxID=1715157 RepID=UPI0008A29DB3|nr:hypothetical protein [Corynebacterium sp. HMSC058E07]OFM60276.1 hypothetical protein HMPREF2678_04770 [Corynebacterium sp. HMSC058E07]